MLYRNTPHVNYVWRRSRAHQRVLSSPAYLVFDEWWGALEGGDNLARVLGREARAGRLRLTLSGVRHKWISDDKRYPTRRGGTVSTNDEFVACWSRGKLWANPGGRPTPCTDHAAEHGLGRRTRGSTVWAEVALAHLSRLKHRPWLSSLQLDRARPAVEAADAFALTANGVWLPEPSACTVGSRGGGADRTAACASPRNDSRHHSLWMSGLLEGRDRAVVRTDELAAYLHRLELRDAALRCDPRRPPRDGCPSPGVLPPPPCIE